MSEGERPSDPRGRALLDALERTAALERKAARARGRNPWVEFTRVGTLGWLLALPIVGGALLGNLLDRALGTGIRCTLGLLTLGLALAGYALYRHADELPKDDD
jgi:ATP synthase protein I